MAVPGTACWDLIDAAARGEDESRAQFAALYSGLVRCLLRERWSNTPHLRLLDDAVQDVSVECLKPNGVLQAADRLRPDGFRAFLHGVVRNIARRHEMQAKESLRRSRSLDGVEDQLQGGDSQSRVFDREWARALMREAARLMAERTDRLGDSAPRRVELLQLRFKHDLPIREIAKRWSTGTSSLHRQYAKARREFKEALLQVVAGHFPGSRETVERECNRLLDLLEGASLARTRRSTGSAPWKQLHANRARVQRRNPALLGGIRVAASGDGTEHLEAMVRRLAPEEVAAGCPTRS